MEKERIDNIISYQYSVKSKKKEKLGFCTFFLFFQSVEKSKKSVDKNNCHTYNKLVTRKIVKKNMKVVKMIRTVVKSKTEDN